MVENLGYPADEAAEKELEEMQPLALAYLEKQKELPFVKDAMLGYPGLYFYDGERMHFRGPAMEEKQKEQKSALIPERIHPKFAVGDRVCRPMWSEHTIREIYVRCNDPVYVCVNEEGTESHIPFSEQDEWERKEQKPAEWSDTDNIGWDEALACVTRAEKAAKNEEELQNAVTAENWLKEIKFKYYVHPVKQEWSKEEYGRLFDIEHYLDGTLQLSPDRKIACIDFLKSLRPQPKAELSEDVKKTLDEVSHILIGLNYKQVAEDYKQAIEKLLSLRPQAKQEWDTHDKAIVNCIVCCLDGQFVPEVARKQALEWFNKHRRDFLNNPSWKPSEEQMEALKRASVNKYLSAKQFDILVSLYEHLKKLIV